MSIVSTIPMFEDFHIAFQAILYSNKGSDGLICLDDKQFDSDEEKYLFFEWVSASKYYNEEQIDFKTANYGDDHSIEVGEDNFMRIYHTPTIQ